jgi:hypothetical protein
VFRRVSDAGAAIARGSVTLMRRLSSAGRDNA